MGFRDLIIHHHMFKNAGTSIDSVAEAHAEVQVIKFEPPGQILKTEHAVEDSGERLPWLTSHAYISRDFLPPKSSLRIAVLRHPIDRLGSVYRFERRQGLAGAGKLSAKMASNYTFPNWTRWHLGRSRTGVIQNFQVSFLVGKKKRTPINQNDLSVAKEIADSQISMGLFDFLTVSGKRWSRQIESEFGLKMDFDSMAKENWTTEDPCLESRLDSIREQLGEDIFSEVSNSNILDLDLYNYVRSMFP